jgi:septum formation protein
MIMVMEVADIIRIKNMRKLILASASPRRRELLEKLGLPFVVEVSDFEENMSLKLRPKDLVTQFAVGKAEAVGIKHSDAVVIGVDTVVEFQGKVIGKPYTGDKAKKILKQLSGKTHRVYSGYCVIDSKTGKRFVRAISTKVTFRKLSSAEIDRYVATKEPLLVAGAYMIQGGAASFVTKVEGDYLNIVGFSLAYIVEVLKEIRLI